MLQKLKKSLYLSAFHEKQSSVICLKCENNEIKNYGCRLLRLMKLRIWKNSFQFGCLKCCSHALPLIKYFFMLLSLLTLLFLNISLQNATYAFTIHTLTCQNDFLLFCSLVSLQNSIYTSVHLVLLTLPSSSSSVLNSMWIVNLV